MLITILIPIIVLIITIALGLLLAVQTRKTKANLSFNLLVFAVAFWVFSNLMVDVSTKESAALFWSKMTIVGPAFIPSLWLFFSYNFPREKRRISLLKKVGFFAPSLIFLFFTPTRWNIQSVRLIPGAAPEVSPGPLYIPLFLYFLIYLGLAFLNLFRSYKISTEIEKLQIKFIFTGAIISTIISLSTNLLLLLIGISQAAGLGPSSVIFFIGATSYAVLKHHLFNIKILATELFTVLLLFLLLINIFLAPTLTQRILNIIVFGGAAIFGMLLIKSVIQEIQLREKAQTLADDLKKAYQELKKLDIAKTEFISIASHQLRTPLTVIKGYISMILEGSYGKVAERAKKPMKNVFKSNERLIRLVNDLLTVSKVETGKIEVMFEKASLEDLILELVNDLKIRAEKKNLYLKFEKPREPLPKILIDKEKIRQVILNILDNAIRYTQHGGITVKVQIPNSKIQILISDTGEGMTKGEASRLFVSFARGSAGIRLWTEGAGLGLYVSKKYTDLHKGKIWAESLGKGKGSTFFIELPIK